MGIFLLSEGCKGLESVQLSGFSKVSDAGFASFLVGVFSDFDRLDGRVSPCGFEAFEVNDARGMLFPCRASGVA